MAYYANIPPPQLPYSTRRRSSVDVEMISALDYGKKLSSFQIQKFTYMFNALFDLNTNGYLERNDIDALVAKILNYTQWDKEDVRYQNIKDVHNIFYECLQDQVRAETAASNREAEIASWEEARKSTTVDASSITLAQWLNMWGKLCYGSAGLSDFPIWVQLLPQIFFDVIDQDKDGVLNKEEYGRFYKDFAQVDASQLNTVINEGYRAMTAGGDYKLNRENFGFCFANFLLGRSIYGPGKYIFGVFDNSEIGKQFQVIYNIDEDEE